MAKKYEYNYDMSFTYQGKRYRIRANTLEELYTKKANKLRDLKENVITYDSNVTVDLWATKAFDTYKYNVQGLEMIKTRYKTYVSPFIGTKPIGTIRSAECQSILNSCSGMSFSHVSKLRQELAFIFESAVDNQMIPLNPAKKLKLPEYVKGSRRSITDTERKHLYACIREGSFLSPVYDHLEMRMPSGRGDQFDRQGYRQRSATSSHSRNQICECGPVCPDPRRNLQCDQEHKAVRSCFPESGRT